MNIKLHHLMVYAAALCSCGTASAQSNATIYGIVDTGIEYANNVNAAGDSVVRVPSQTGSISSRLGVRGSESIDRDLFVNYQLESGIAMDTGALGQGGRLFGRHAWVGLKGRYGSVSIGRQYNMTYHSLVKGDVMGPSIHSASNMDSYLPNARSDNSLAYLGNFGNFVLGASHSFGRDASPAGASGPSATNCLGESAADSHACRQQTALLGYDKQDWGVFASWDKQHGGAGATNGLTSSRDTDERSAVTGYWIFGNSIKVAGGWLKRNTLSAMPLTRDLYFIGSSIPVGQWTFDAQYSALNLKNSPDKSTLYAARATYFLSKRTALYASYGYIVNKGAAAIAVDTGGTVGKGMNQTGLMSGIRHSF